MILIAGGTGTLGTQVVRLLTARGLEVRILTREPARARHLQDDLVEIVPGDVRDLRAVERAAVGARTVISAIQGLTGTGGYNPQTVDRQGNSNLIQAAQTGAAEHFILVSVQGAAPDHPMELARMKYLAEQELKASGLAWTIIRASAFMETWAALIGEPLLKTGKTRIFGRGNNPINFVSAHDVARFVELAVIDPAMQGELVEVGGPENFSMRQVAQTFETTTGKVGRKSHVPLPMMRLMSVLMRPVKPALARQIQAGVVMDTHDMSFDPSETGRRYPSISLTSLAEVVRRDYVG
ncbi:hypothetical protein BH24ACT19_BH24ACT19_18580 [soil metagenome]